jgi:hypothetical protein
MRKAFQYPSSAISTISLGGIALRRYPTTTKDLEAWGCPPKPRTHGFEEAWHTEAVVSIAVGDATYVTGDAGCGKDYTGESIAYLTGMPLVQLQVTPNSEPQDWVGRTDLGGDGLGGTETIDVEGLLARACRGFEKKLPNGDTIRVPAFILISDGDRARDLEIFRHAFESDEERRFLFSPTTGKQIPVFPGTVFWMTGNSAIDGDGGKGMVVSQLDASIVNRLAGVYAGEPTERFERAIVRSLAPAWQTAQVNAFVSCMRGVRKALKSAGLPLEISARTASQLVKRACLYEGAGKEHQASVRDAWSCVSGHLADPDSRAVVEGAIDPHYGSKVIGG